MLLLSQHRFHLLHTQSDHRQLIAEHISVWLEAVSIYIYVDWIVVGARLDRCLAARAESTL